ncbi:MAG: hypothetical protein ACK5Q5_19795 [Planctomycetaceae bacterium]
MKTLALALTTAAALAAFGENTADAGCGYGYTGRFGNYGGYSRYTSNYFYRPTPFAGHIHHNVNPNTATWGGGHLHWHDTSHYDYQPGGFVPHGNHYQPGGYIYHQDGHFDLHH